MAQASAKPAEQPTHTQGPWTFDSVGTRDEIEFYINSAGHHCVADEIILEADARLIAAAPDMLAALKETTLQLQYLADKFGETGTGAQVLARVNAAIAKATTAA